MDGVSAELSDHGVYVIKHHSTVRDLHGRFDSRVPCGDD